MPANRKFWMLFIPLCVIAVARVVLGADVKVGRTVGLTAAHSGVVRFGPNLRCWERRRTQELGAGVPQGAR